MSGAEAGAVCWDTLDSAPLVYTNAGSAAFRYEPACFDVCLDTHSLQAVYGPARRVRLLALRGWAVEKPAVSIDTEQGTICWHVRPAGIPTTCHACLRIVVEHRDGRVTEVIHPVTIEVRAFAQFVPSRHALPFANTVEEFGRVAPSRHDFEATYCWRPLASVFFHGLYSRVLCLATGQDGRLYGGMCTGMARSALEFSLRAPERAIAEQDAQALRAQARLWHGRQLADRALLASTAAWLTRGSRAAYLAFRRGMLADGRTELAMDVNVPRPWRRDLLAALIGSGHTVVPYALRQSSDDRAEVWVYDPNYPNEPEAGRNIVHFDLAQDSYTYRHVDGRQPGKPSKVLAVSQAHYRAADTGVLGGLLSLLLFPPQQVRSRSRSVFAILLLALLGAWRLARRLPRC